VTINYADSSKTVLLVFAPGCAACDRVAPYWREIEKASRRSSQYRIFAMSLGDEPGSSAFLAANGLNSEMLANIDAGMRQAYKISLTPMTIVVDSNGNVEKVWAGVFNQQMKRDVESYFGISQINETK
jgi:peroxiredoxin